MNQAKTLLPPPRDGVRQSAIARRRSIRRFDTAPIALADLGELLWAAQGHTDDEGRRATPSAGGAYPLSLRISAHNVENLAPAVYGYTPGEHSLAPLSRPDARRPLAEAAIGEQLWVADAAAVILVAVDVGDMTSRFHEQPPTGERGARYAWMEVGAAAQNIQVQAAAAGLGAMLVGGFDDARVADAFGGLDGRVPGALVCAGRPSP